MKIVKQTEFVTKNDYEINYRPLSEAVDVTHFINGNNLFLMDYTNSTKVSGCINKESSENIQRIVSTETLAKITDNPSSFHQVAKEDNSYIYYVKKGFLEYQKEIGDNSVLAEMRKKEAQSLNDFVNKKCFNHSDDSQYEFIQFVHNKNHLKVWKDSKGEMCMTPFVFDYISANLDNGTYHLDSLIEHLMQRDDVAFIINISRWAEDECKLLKCPLSENEPGLNRIISDIPGYNAEEGKDETITLVYYPKPEHIDSIMNWEHDKNDRGGRIWNLDNYIVRDLLGCDKFSKKPILETESVVPKRKFKN